MKGYLALNQQSLYRLKIVSMQQDVGITFPSDTADGKQVRYGTLRLMRDATLGMGAYGQVCKATLDELPCAAKLLHPILVDQNDTKNQTRFEQECRFLSKIRHPNIVQYLGVAQDGETGLPILLMELMDDSLTHFLEQSEELLAYHVQVNISHDIALAVAFLHLNHIVHRDLSSNNVLVIGAGIRTKVTDFGMSMLTELRPRMTGLTKCPGTPVYMSPEALLDPPIYTEKLDCFQAGVLMIQTITRKFPDPGPAMNRVRDARFPTGWFITPVREVERRQNHLTLIPQTHPMLRIAVDCLNDMDSKRPSAQQICQNLSALKETPEYGQSLEGRRGERDREVQEREELIQQLRQENQEREKEVREKERENRKLTNEMEKQASETKRAMEGVREKEEEIKSLQDQLQQMKEDRNQKNGKLQDALELIKVKDQVLQEIDQSLCEKDQLLQEKDQLLQENDHTIHQLQQMLQSASSYTYLVSGPGLQSATANYPTHVRVIMSDVSGRPCSLQQNVTAELEYPGRSSTIQAAVCMISPSQYEISYKADRQGQQKLHIQVNGSEINGSPYTITVYPDPTHITSPVKVVTEVNKPYGIAVNSRHEIVIAERENHHVSIIGKKKSTFGSYGDRPKQMKFPAGVAVDDADNIYVSSQHKLQKLTSSGRLIKCVGCEGCKEGEFDDPRGVTIRGNQVYVCEANNHRIQVLDLDLNFIRCIGSYGIESGEFHWPLDVAFDTAGNMYVAEFGNKRVQVMDSSGQFIRVFGHEGEGKLSLPSALHIVNMHVYVSDNDQDCIAVYLTSGQFVISFARYGERKERIYHPNCITSCANGHIYVCSSGNNRLLAF